MNFFQFQLFAGTNEIQNLKMFEVIKFDIKDRKMMFILSIITTISSS